MGLFDDALYAVMKAISKSPTAVKTLEYMGEAEEREKNRSPSERFIAGNVKGALKGFVGNELGEVAGDAVHKVWDEVHKCWKK
jgi:hypothetical protein